MKILITIAALVATAVPALAITPAEPAPYWNGSMPSHASQGYLGVDIRDISDEHATELSLKEARGAEIVVVDHDGPAGKCGLRVHDVILQMNDQPIEGEEQLRRMLHETPAGRTVHFVISRDGQQQTINVQLANREEVEKRAWDQHFAVPEPEATDTQEDEAPPMTLPPPNVQPQHTYPGFGFMGRIATSSNYTGAQFDSMSPQLSQYFGTQPGVGLLVKSIDHNSPAEAAGLHAGDVVLRVNSSNVNSRSDWMHALQNSGGKPLTISILRDRKPLTLTMSSNKRSSLEPPYKQRMQHIASVCTLHLYRPNPGCFDCI